MKKRVLFLCTHNSVRSQMAEGLLREMYGDRFEVYSAGTSISSVNPFAVEAMKQAGIDISNCRSKHINEYADQNFDYIVTVCDRAKEVCPYFAGGTEKIHYGFEDPSAVKGSHEEILEVFLQTRDKLREWLEKQFGP